MQVLSLVGLAFLLFLAGLDVELGWLRGRLLRLAGLGAGRSKLLSGALGRLGDTTAQIRVRGAVLLLIGFVALAERFGLPTNCATRLLQS